jgi:hypothetical protein
MRFIGTWCSQDLFFLMSALRRGDMSCAEVAGFVGRDVGEVRDKAEQIGIKAPQLDSRAVEAKSRSDAPSHRSPRTILAGCLFERRTKGPVVS